MPENLQEAKTDILTTAECEGYWTAAQVHETHVCIYDRANQRTGACNVSTVWREGRFRRRREKLKGKLGGQAGNGGCKTYTLTLAERTRDWMAKTSRF